MARPFLRFRCWTQSFTGAAQTWLVVKVPATAAGVSDTISARSRFFPLLEPLPVPRRLISQKTPAARKPFGAVIEPAMGVNEFFNSGRDGNRARNFCQAHRIGSSLRPSAVRNPGRNGANSPYRLIGQ